MLVRERSCAVCSIPVFVADGPWPVAPYRRLGAWVNIVLWNLGLHRVLVQTSLIQVAPFGDNDWRSALLLVLPRRRRPCSTTAIRRLRLPLLDEPATTGVESSLELLGLSCDASGDIALARPLIRLPLGSSCRLECCNAYPKSLVSNAAVVSTVQGVAYGIISAQCLPCALVTRTLTPD